MKTQATPSRFAGGNALNVVQATASKITPFSTKCQREVKKNNPPDVSAILARIQSVNEPSRLITGENQHPYLKRKFIAVDSILYPISNIYCVSAAKLAHILSYRPRTKDRFLTGDVIVLPHVTIGKSIVQTLEFIDESGLKTYLAGVPQKGSGFIVRDADYPKLFIIGEGFATVAACLDCLDDVAGSAKLDVMAIAVGGCNNLMPVAEGLRAKHPASAFVVIADIDVESGRINAMAHMTARSTDSTITFPWFDKVDNDHKDYWDLVYNVDGGKKEGTRILELALLSEISRT